jgi:hypothetical protein
MRISLFVVIFFSAAVEGLAHNSYAGGYSGAPGMRTFASSCHGGTGGTTTVSGFPNSYVPGQVYQITIKRLSGSPIVNFNATTRLGTTASVAGTFVPVLNTALYTGADGCVYASPHAIDSAVFRWTAPASGSGTVNFYAAAFQGITSSSNGQSKGISMSASEIVSAVKDNQSVPADFRLYQNYPNPFNPGTAISFQLPAFSHVDLRIFTGLGHEVAMLINQPLEPGEHVVRWDARLLPSGTYFYRLRARRVAAEPTSDHSETKRMILLK